MLIILKLLSRITLVEIPLDKNNNGDVRTLDKIYLLTDNWKIKLQANNSFQVT